MEGPMPGRYRLLLASVVLLVTVLGGAQRAAAKDVSGAPTVTVSRDSAHSCVSFPDQMICSTSSVRSLTRTFPSGAVLVSTQANALLTGRFADCHSRAVLRQHSISITTQENVPFLDAEVFHETTRGTCAPQNCTVLNKLVVVHGEVKINSSQISCTPNATS
jgi:hypothetical protein